MKYRNRIAILGGFLLILSLNSSVDSAHAYSECSKSATFQNGYIYLAFKDSTAICTWTIPSDASAIDYLLVAGGGSGGSRHAGGGGAGGMLTGTGVSLSGITSLNITVGSGGASVVPSGLNYAVGLNGGNSIIAKNIGSGTFTTVTATGGGGGEAGGVGTPTGGGSGGGAQSATTSTFIAGQGNRGGPGGYLSGYYSAGGGGGAGAVGADAVTFSGGNGGQGAIWISDFTTTTATSLSLTQTNQTSGNQVYFAGGGGGSTTGTTVGNGALGGGGDAVLGNNTAVSGTANSGGGGGGSGCCNGGSSGAGGSGVAIVRYVANAGLVISTSGSIIYRASTPIVASANIDGKVSFYANGRIIPNCRNLLTTSRTVTCNWKPSLHGTINLTASITSTTFSAYKASSKTTAMTAKRTGNR